LIVKMCLTRSVSRFGRSPHTPRTPSTCRAIPTRQRDPAAPAAGPSDTASRMAGCRWPAVVDQSVVEIEPLRVRLASPPDRRAATRWRTDTP
jgi:hypothetical protein